MTDQLTPLELERLKKLASLFSDDQIKSLSKMSPEIIDGAIDMVRGRNAIIYTARLSKGAAVWLAVIIGGWIAFNELISGWLKNLLKGG